MGFGIMTQSTFAILLGGALTPNPRLLAALSGARVIAADGGMRHAAALGVTPELWVGDFDSTSAELLERWPDVERMPYPAAKAATDGEIAVAEAHARGATRILLVGALGGERSDHAFQLYLSAIRLAEEGFDILLTSGEEEAMPLLPGEKRLDVPEGSLFSILGVTALDGLSIVNARYPLDDFHLPFGSSRTVSNVANGPVDISLRSGKALILARPFDFSGA